MFASYPGALSYRQSESQGMEGVSPIGGSPPALGATVDRSDIFHALLHVVTNAHLCWHRAEDSDACAGFKAPRTMLPARPAPGLRALPGSPPAGQAAGTRRLSLTFLRPVSASCPPRPFRAEKPLTTGRHGFHPGEHLLAAR